MLWRDYRRLTQLVADLKDGRLDQRLEPDRIRGQVQRIAVDYGGVPHLVAALLVARILTDDAVKMIVTQVRARSA